MLNLLNLFRDHSLRDPEHTFIVCKYTNKSYSYQAAADAAESMVRGFSARGLKPGSKIMLLAENTWFFLPLLAACADRQLTLLPLEPSLHPNELEGIIKETSPALIIVDNLKLVSSVNVTAIPTADLLCELNREGEIEELSARKKPFPVLFIYTSGTTGSSKAVMLTEQNLLEDAKSLQTFYNLSSEDR